MSVRAGTDSAQSRLTGASGARRRTAHEAIGEPEAEKAPSPNARIAFETGPKSGSPISLPERRQGRGRPVRRVRDRVDGAADERTSGERERKSGQSANDRGDERRTQAPPTARRRHFALRVAGRDCVPGSRASPDDDPLQPASDVEVEAHERGKTPSGKPLDCRSHDAAAERGGRNQGKGALRARAGLGKGETGPDTGAAQCAAGAADDRQHRRDGKGGRTFRRGGEDQSSCSAGRDARQTAARCGARPSPGGDSRGAAQPEPQQLARDRKRRGRAEHRHLSRAGHIPARIAQQRARGGMTGARAEAAQRFRRSQRMKQLGRLAAVVLDGTGTSETIQQRFVRITSRLPDSLRLRHRHPLRPHAIVLLFDDIREDEPVAVARDRADEARLARIVAEGAAERPDGLAQRAVGDDDVRPDAIEDVAAVHRLVTSLDQQDEQVEIARDERHLAAFAQEEPAPGREREITEAVSNHDGPWTSAKSKSKGS